MSVKALSQISIDNYLLPEYAYIKTPTLTSPADSAADVGETPTLQASAFAVGYGSDTHASSQWQVASDSGFSTVVWDSGADGANLESIEVPSGNLDEDTTYYWRVRYTGTAYGDSQWSNSRSFGTGLYPSVDTPTNQSPTDAETDIGETPTLQADAFSVSNGSDTHASSDWQISTSELDFSTPVWESLDDSSNKTSIIVPSGNLEVDTTYYWRVRYTGSDSGDSEWSTPTEFTTATAFGHDIDYSCRFNSADSAYLHRTPASAGDRKTWTMSMWIKKAETDNGDIFTASDATNRAYYVGGSSTYFVDRDSGGVQFEANSSKKWRDISNWSHVLIAVDTTDAVAANRLKLIVNGNELTYSNVAVPDLDDVGSVNNTVLHTLGAGSSDGSTVTSLNNCYLADVHFIDGQAKSASDFGQFVNGQWCPKAYAGTYGTNGFHLDFSDSSDLGKDVSGNGNHWTSSGLTSDDQMLDTPTNNFCTPIGTDVTKSNAGTKGTYSEGLLKVVTDSTAYGTDSTTMCPNSGKWYAELKAIDAGALHIGVFDVDVKGDSLPFNVGKGSNEYAYRTTGDKISNNTASAYGAGFSDDDIIGIALDLDNGKIYFSKNGTWQNSGNPVAGTGEAFSGLVGHYGFGVSDWSGSQSRTYHWNFGQDPTYGNGYSDDNGYGNFAYEPPTGFLALCGKNLPDCTVTPNEGFDVVTRTGTGAAASISSLNFQPDWFVTKNRDETDDWKNVDSVRGATKELEWNTTDAETTDANGLTSFDTNGYSLGTGANGYNDSGENFVDYLFKKGSSYGIDIVAFNGSSTAQNISHNLGAVPEAMLVTGRDEGYTGCVVYHHNLDTSAPEDKYLILNSNAAVADSNEYWNDTAPTSTQFTVNHWGWGASNTYNYIAYLMRSVEGFSKFGSYEGNGNADGPFIYTGFLSKFIMIKNINTNRDWMVNDNVRNSHNVVTHRLFPNLADVEGTLSAGILDILSNGFKISTDASDYNLSGDTYIYLAFAENPFKLSRAV